MVEKAQRGAVEERRRDADADPEWEVFAREEDGDPLRRVGAVRANDADEAHEQATRLFCWYADEVWVCPADEIRKYSTDATDDSEASVPEPSDEGRYHEL